MATSIQMVGQRVAMLDDGDLLILMGMMLDEVGSMAHQYPMLDVAAEQWKRSRATYGPGTLDLNFEEISKNELAQAQLLSLLAAIEAQIVRYGDVLSADMLNKKWKIKGVRFYDYKSSRLMSSVNKLRSLF